jgi:hypothetical protein
VSEHNFFERHSRIIIFVLVLAIFVGTDLLFGTIYKCIVGYAWVDAPLNRAILGEKAYRIFSPIYHHGLAPNVDLTGFWGVGRYRLATDSLGFRDDKPRQIPLESTNRRILLIGDSFTEGVGLPYADTFAGMLAKDLAKDRVEILNAAVVSYCATTYWKKIRYLIEDVKLKVDEVAVFMDLSDVTDEWGLSVDERGFFKMEGPPKGDKASDPSIRLLHHNSIALFFLYQSFIRNLDDVFKGYFISEAHGRINKPNIKWSYDPEEFKTCGIQNGLARMEESMGQLRCLLAKHGIRMAVAVYPWPDQIVRNDLNCFWVRFWQEWCRKHNTDLLNYFPAFINAGNTKKDHARILKQYFVKGDAHWNRQGHRLIADQFISFYNSRKK